MWTFAFRLTAVVSLAFAFAACASAHDAGVTGDDMNVEDAPCKALTSLTCRPGVTAISLLNCPSGEGRCSGGGGGCELATTVRCLPGYAATSTHCKGTNAVRCAPVDTGGADAGHDARGD